MYLSDYSTKSTENDERDNWERADNVYKILDFAETKKKEIRMTF